MIEIQKKLTPYNYTAMTNKQNKYIVIHYCGAVGTAKNNVDYFASQKLSASASYFVDENSIWQCVEDKNRAWHCGGGLQGSGGHAFYQICTNSNSIGIEMCVKRTANGKWYFEDETVKNTIDLTKYLMNKYNIPINNVIRHYDVTGKICPEPYVSNETAWKEFKQRLTESEDEAMTTEERTKFNALVNTVSKLNTQVDELTTLVKSLQQPVYNYIDKNMPITFKPTIEKLVIKGYLKGSSNGELNLTYDFMRQLVINDRAGLYD